MTIRITINTDNAAFGEDRDLEVSRILQAAARHIEVTGDYNWPLRDANGNTVGRISASKR